VLFEIEELFTYLQTVHGLTQKEPNVNTLGVSHQATLSPTINCESTPEFQFSHFLTFSSFNCLGFYQFLPKGKYFASDAAFKMKAILCAGKIGNFAAGRKYQ
jgi:hypothetical protein